MREIRQSGSEGGVPRKRGIPTPIQPKKRQQQVGRGVPAEPGIVSPLLSYGVALPAVRQPTEAAGA